VSISATGTCPHASQSAHFCLIARGKWVTLSVNQKVGLMSTGQDPGDIHPLKPLTLPFQGPWSDLVVCPRSQEANLSIHFFLGIPTKSPLKTTLSCGRTPHPQLRLRRTAPHAPVSKLDSLSSNLHQNGMHIMHTKSTLGHKIVPQSSLHVPHEASQNCTQNHAQER
jgi:hypothetical protein